VHFPCYTPFGLRGIILAASLAAMPATMAANQDEAPFLIQNHAAMETMMRQMTVNPSGDVDRDFIALMIPHHQGAIDMARAELQYGHNEQLHRIAQEIIVAQQQEITAMRAAFDEPLSRSTASSHEAPTAMAVAPRITTETIDSEGSGK
jgi:Domain of unknown function (DUF305)